VGTLWVRPASVTFNQAGRRVSRLPSWRVGIAVLLATATISLQTPDPASSGQAPPPEPSHDHHTSDLQLAAAAEVSAAAPATLPRTYWTVTADSQETATPGYTAAASIDGNTATFWHTKWTGTDAPLPHTLTIDMHDTVIVAALRYLPRPAATGRNGNIGRYEIHVSADGTTWGNRVATGTFADDSAQKTVSFPSRSARYVRLTALTEAGGRGPWSNAAEVNLLGHTDPVLPRAGWTVTADSQETATPGYMAAAAIDGSTATFWHTKWTGTDAPLPHTFTIDMHEVVLVAGLAYLPRPAATGRNGNIGRYQIHVSTDSATWGSPVLTGTFADTSIEKTVFFPASTARYVRLTALTEAGGRGPWSNAAEINLLSGVPRNDPRFGVWSGGIGFPLVPAAAAQLPNGKVLTWSAYQPNAFSGGTGQTQTAILDPATSAVSLRTVTETGHDMFCPGTALLPDGRLLVSGGNDSGKTSIYNPANNTWTAGATMTVPRGYHGSTTLSDGRVFTLGGSWSGGLGGKNGEAWSPSLGWRRLTGVPVAPILTNDPEGVYRADNHGWFFNWSFNRVFHAGPSRQLNMFDVTGSGSSKSAGVRGDDSDAMNGNAVMYDIGKILTVGGAPAYVNSTASNRAYVIDINNGVVVRKVAPMNYPRAFHNSVVLPDGTVLVLGGTTYAKPFSDENSIYNAELWDPATERFTRLAAAATPRNYHSVALLLPDGRVFSGGGGLCGGCATNHADGQIFTPPYLLNPDGTARSRPAITAAPATATVGTTVTVDTDRAVERFALVRLGAVTHTVNNDQRRIPLVPTAVTSSSYRVTLPAYRGVALPGYYMLFALDSAGVPSVARMIRIS
jgi:galactose oxidase